MRIVLANRYLYPRGGDATYTLSLARLLRERGHEVICFGQDAPENDLALAAPILADPIDFPSLLRSGGLRSAVAVLARTIYSRHVKGRFAQLLDRARPDIVHLQNIHHHLSPSVIDAAAERRIPVVWTLHDFSVICPNGNLFSKDRPCEECRPARFHRMVVNRCKRGSLPASLIAAAESTIHRAMRIFDRVNLFIVPSRFMLSKLQAFGFYPDRIVHLSHFLVQDYGASPPPALSGETGEPPPAHLLFAGRLIPEKGIETVLRAATLAMDLHVKIAGDGPMRDIVREACQRHPHFEHLGWLERAALREAIGKARAIVVPSECFETFSFAVLEAFSAGRPVVGSARGAIPELVEGATGGLLFNPGDPEDLARAARRLMDDPEMANRMGSAGQRWARKHFSPEAHYEGLMVLYSRAMAMEVTRAA